MRRRARTIERSLVIVRRRKLGIEQLVNGPGRDPEAMLALGGSPSLEFVLEIADGHLERVELELERGGQ